MTLNDLIIVADWNNIKKAILELYPNIRNQINNYKKMYKNLLLMNHIENHNKITIIIEKIDDSDNWDISGIHQNDNEKYAMGFSDWQEWLGYEIHDKNIKEMSYANIIAHCFYEMTFYGETNEIIQMKAKFL